MPEMPGVPSLGANKQNFLEGGLLLEMMVELKMFFQETTKLFIPWASKELDL